MKNIFINSAELLNRQDIINCINNHSTIDDIEDINLKLEINNFINIYNRIISSVFQNYLDLFHTDILSSDNFNKIHFYNLSYSPTKIISVSDEFNHYFDFSVFPSYIFTHCANKIYHITYKYIPKKINDLNAEFNFKDINKNIICYGIVSEYLASKNMLNESKFWQTKFLNELFYSKSHKERRIKSTFKI